MLPKIEKALTELVLDQPFFAVLAMKLQIIESTETETFSTDGKSLYVNPEFLKELKPKEVVTVLAHEVLHCAMNHITRAPSGYDHKVWNRAVDNEANWCLEEYNQGQKVQPFPFPFRDSIEMQDRFRGVACESVYKQLMKEPQQQQHQDGAGAGTGKGKKEPGKSLGDVMPVKPEEKAELEQSWQQAVVQAVKVSKNKGKIPGAIQELVKELTSTKLDWKQLLRDFLSQAASEDWSWRKVNQRYSGEFSFPSLYNEKAGHVVFAIDTSGSINADILAEYLAEAQQCLDELQPEKLTVVYCDSKINKVEDFGPGDKIPLRLVGRGGTDFRPVFELFKDEAPKVLIYLTDLMGTFPTEEPDFPVLWVVLDQSSFDRKAPFGDTITI